MFVCFVLQQVQIKMRDPSVTVRDTWILKEDMDFSRLGKLSLPTIEDPEDLYVDSPSLRPKQNGCHIADNIFKCIFQKFGGRGVGVHFIEISYVFQGYIDDKLTHCGLVTPYGDWDLGQHWLR